MTQPITAVRLRPYDRTRGHLMRTYTSSSLQIYRAGEGSVPSAWRVLDDEHRGDIAELTELPQFEIREFDTAEALFAEVQAEMEHNAYLGLPPVRAYIEGLPPAQRAVVERALGQGPPVPPPARDLSVLDAPPKPGTLDVDALEGSVDYAAEIAAVEAKIAKGGAPKAVAKLKRTLRRLQIEQADAAQEAAPADDA